MTDYTRAEILAARQTWIEFLQQPERRKAKGQLSRGGECRCCLGHACQALDATRQSGWTNDASYPPFNIILQLGMWNEFGGTKRISTLRGQTYTRLDAVNDMRKITPQQIGDYLATVIEGGEDTPFRPLSDYPEARAEAQP